MGSCYPISLSPIRFPFLARSLIPPLSLCTSLFLYSLPSISLSLLLCTTFLFLSLSLFISPSLSLYLFVPHSSPPLPLCITVLSLYTLSLCVCTTVLAILFARPFSLPPYLNHLSLSSYTLFLSLSLPQYHSSLSLFTLFLFLSHLILSFLTVSAQYESHDMK